MDINREVFKRLPPEDQTLALFDGLSQMPRAVAAAVSTEMAGQFVKKGDCIHANPPKDQPATFSWATVRNLLIGGAIVGATIGGAMGWIPAPPAAPQAQPPAVTAPR